MTKILTLTFLLILTGLKSKAQDFDTLLFRNSNEVIEKALKEFENGKYLDAKKYFKMIHSGDSNYVRAISELVYTYSTNEEYDSAISLANKALEQPSNYTAYLTYQLGSALDLNGDLKKSLDVFEEGLKKYPYHTQILYNYGVTLMKDKQYELALEIFTRNLNTNPFHNGSHLQLGLIMIYQGHRAKAMMSLLTYLAINPSNTKVVTAMENLLNGVFEDESTINEFSENQFEYIDDLLNAKVALNEKFKSELDFDAEIVKQSEVLIRSIKNNEKTDFWDDFYLPFFIKIKENKQIPEFIYLLYPEFKEMKFKVG